jgi:hypothetical protein
MQLFCYNCHPLGLYGSSSAHRAVRRKPLTAEHFAIGEAARSVLLPRVPAGHGFVSELGSWMFAVSK